MDIRSTTGTCLVFLAAAFGTACSSGSSNGFGNLDSGSPPQDGSMPSDAGGGTDSNPPPVDAGTATDAPPGVDGGHFVDGGDAGDGVYDFGCGGNTACPLSTVCCTMPGHPATFGCVAPPSCPSGDQISCDGPDECVGTSTPVCCGVAVGDGTGTFPSCGASALGTSCTTSANCVKHFAQNCNDTSTVEICHFSSDCTDPNNPKCCTFTSDGGTSLTFCVDGLTALAGKCH